MQKLLSYLLFFPVLLFNQDSTLVIYEDSPIFIVDTQNPSVTWIVPNDGESYLNGEQVFCEYWASDNSFDDTPISIFLSDLIGGNFDTIANSISNVGYIDIQLPEINTAFARFRILATDHFGNLAQDVSDGYITIGIPPVYGEQDSTLIVLADSPSITTDTIDPIVILNSPNGDESFEIGSEMPIEWTAQDDSFNETAISVYLAPYIGSIFNPFITGIPNTEYTSQFAPELNSAFVLLKIEATDFFGNSAIDVGNGYFTIGEPEGTALEDSLLSVFDDSENFIVDSIDPVIQLISPNGGEQFDSGEVVSVEWYATDNSFTGEDIDIAIATEIGGWFISIAEDIPNYGVFDVQFPEVDMAFVRLKLTGIDYFGNISVEYGDNYFILGNPFDEFGANEIDEFVILNWGWGLSHLVVIRPEALTFLQPGDEIYIVDEQGIIEEGCPDVPGEGIGSVSVATAVVESSLDSLYIFPCIGSVDLCGLGGPRLPGYITGNAIHYYIYDSSQGPVYEIIPESYEYGEGIFGEPFSVVESFQQEPVLSSLPLDLVVNTPRADPEFSYSVYRNGDTLLSGYDFEYYIDQDVLSGDNYCYVIDLLDSDDNIMLTSDETCIDFGSANILPGDITQDQVVNVLDIVMIVDYILNNTTLTETELIASDLNGDSVLNVVDLVILVEMILNQ